MSLGNVLGTVAPIAAGYFTGGLSSGFAGLTAGTMSGIAGGALAGAGIAALSGDDILMGAASGGLGGYGGAGMAGANTAAKAAAQQTLGAGTLNAQQAAMAGYTGPTSMMQSAGLGGLNAGAMQTGTSSMANSMYPGGGTSSSNVLGSGVRPQANLDLSKAGGYQYNANELAGKGIGRTQDFSGGMMGDLKSTAIPEAQFGKDYGFSDIARELGEGDTTKGYMKAGLTALPVGVAALTPEYEEDSYNDNPMNRYDPNRRLNLSNDTGISEALKKDSGLRLIAQGGMIKGYAEGGNVGILNRPSLNLNNQQALNLNTGSNIPAPVANPTIISTPGQNVGGSSNQPFSVPTRKEYGTGGPNVVPGDYIGGLGTNYSQDIAGNFRRIAQGGAIKGYAQGGYLDGGNVGDGMSDDIPATINGNQPAALADGEFVVPADVVSHLGNGSSNAGSRRLYEMMDEVRKARTGREQQGKEINAERYMPA